VLLRQLRTSGSVDIAQSALLDPYINAGIADGKQVHYAAATSAIRPAPHGYPRGRKIAHFNGSAPKANAVSLNYNFDKSIRAYIQKMPLTGDVTISVK